jgi:predicted nucleic acid-binding protein
MAVLIDASALLRVHDTRHPQRQAMSLLLVPDRAARHRLCLCAQTMIEFWVVATRPPANNGFGLTPHEVSADLDRYLKLLPRLPEPPDVADRWLRLVTHHGVSGKPAHDVRLVALMEAHGVRRLLTLNPGDFARYPNVECVAPDQLLAAGP